MKAAAGNVKKVSLELGGKGPNVVYADADIETAINGAASAIFFNHGQCCCAGSRLLIEQPIFDDVVAGVAEIARNTKIAAGYEDGGQMGLLVSQEQRERVTGFLDSGFADGAEGIVGGERHGDRGYFVEPTVLVNTRPDMKVIREEIFGPVVAAIPFSGEVEATANNSEYGLAAGVWTRDATKALRTVEALRAGTAWVNCYNIFDAALPFGGYKQSGWGREMGAEVLNNYLETKAVCIGL